VGFDQPQTIVPGGYASDLAAPIWGRFMHLAAGRRNAGWIRQPPGIAEVHVCRASGSLPHEGCLRAEALDADGQPTGRPVVGLEYFREGTEPTSVCLVHATGESPRAASSRGPGLR
jgi:membrane carboxypeptidase/penicillin-binding protein